MERPVANHYRNLYQKSSLPDNYTDPDFLTAQMILNPKLKHWTFLEAAIKASRVALQISATFFFIVAYHHLYSKTIEPSTIFLCTSLTTIFGYLTYQIHKVWPLENGFIASLKQLPKEHIRVTVVYLLFSYQLTPILRTLTLTISKDTIHASSAIMFLIHLFTTDYGINGFLVSKAFSVNSAIIGTICLVSRMSSDYHSFALLTMALQLFILFPLFARIIWDSPPFLGFFLVLAALFSATVSSLTFLFYSIIIFFIIFFYPYVFASSIEQKQNIYGPWDEAEIQ